MSLLQEFPSKSESSAGRDTTRQSGVHSAKEAAANAVEHEHHIYTSFLMISLVLKLKNCYILTSGEKKASKHL